ncbi:hypothetical protein [Virgibacillus sp. DJP39]|uniref:hypothetical protein n=1 Tax=Virgibacillus sp. DJP39 TaxID=3409790 RepID=UPI003BB74AE5
MKIDGRRNRIFIVKWFLIVFAFSYVIISLPNLFGIGEVIDWVPEASLFQKVRVCVIEGLQNGWIFKSIISSMIGIAGVVVLILRLRD